MSKPLTLQALDSKGKVIEIPGYGIIYAAGTTVPADASAGYAPGCIFIDLNSTTDGSFVFQNEGTLASSDFNAIPSATSGTLELAFALDPFATVTERDLWVAPFACRVTAISYVPSTLQGGAMTATVVKATGTATPVKTTTPMIAADAIDLNAGAYTVVSPALTATTGDLALVAGQRIALDYSAAPTVAHWALAISLVRL